MVCCNGSHKHLVHSLLNFLFITSSKNRVRWCLQVFVYWREGFWQAATGHFFHFVIVQRGAKISEFMGMYDLWLADIVIVKGPWTGMDATISFDVLLDAVACFAFWTTPTFRRRRELITDWWLRWRLPWLRWIVVLAHFGSLSGFGFIVCSRTKHADKQSRDFSFPLCFSDFFEIRWQVFVVAARRPQGAHIAAAFQTRQRLLECPRIVIYFIKPLLLDGASDWFFKKVLRHRLHAHGHTLLMRIEIQARLIV